MKKRLLVAALFSIANILVAAPAKKTIKPIVPRIAIVDLDAALRQEKQALLRMQELATMKQELSGPLQAEEQKLQAEFQAAGPGMSLLSAKAQAELVGKMKAYQLKVQQQNEKLVKRDGEIKKELLDKNMLILKDLIKELKYNMVMYKNAFALINDNILAQDDLTQRLIARYNIAFPVKKEKQNKVKGPKKAKS